MKKIDRIRVLICGMNGMGLGDSILKALQLSDFPYEFYGTDMSSTAADLFEVKKGFLVPPADSPDYVETVLDICKEEKVDVVIPRDKHL